MSARGSLDVRPITYKLIFEIVFTAGTGTGSLDSLMPRYKSALHGSTLMQDLTFVVKRSWSSLLFLTRLQDQGTANALLSNVSISIDWAAACVAGDDTGTTAGANADITSVVVKIGDFDLKFAGVHTSSLPLLAPTFHPSHYPPNCIYLSVILHFIPV